MNVRSKWLVVASAALLAIPAVRATAATAQEAKALTRESDEAVKTDANLPKYQTVSGITGNLSSVGSDTMVNLVTTWAQSFKSLYPSVRIQIEGKGSSSAPPALIAGTAQLGPMSREMKSSESDDFEGRFGYKPTKIAVAIDALSVYVHKDNPIKQLTLAQLDAIFGKQRKAGHEKDVTTWGDLGLTGDWAAIPISLYGRNSASGTNGFFKEHVLLNGDYKDTVKEQPGSASVVLGVTEDRGGIGYSGIGFNSSGVRTVPLAKDAKAEANAVSAANVYSKKYPLWRFLYVYVNKSPNKPLDPLVKEFLTFTLSEGGQQNTVKEGYFPLPAKIAGEELARIK